MDLFGSDDDFYDPELEFEALLKDQEEANVHKQKPNPPPIFDDLEPFEDVFDDLVDEMNEPEPTATGNPISNAPPSPPPSRPMTPSPSPSPPPVKKSSWEPISIADSLIHPSVPLKPIAKDTIHIKSKCLPLTSHSCSSSFRFGASVTKWREEASKEKKKQLLSNQLFKPKSKFQYDLFTDLYRPSSFKNLLSDDVVNRKVLGFIKSFEPLVFSNQSSAQPPSLPVLLLHGVPGIGKTTLAEVCAQQLGYKPLTINASLERTDKSLLEPLQGSLGCHSLSLKRNNKGKIKKEKPTLVILDEVDGLNSADVKRSNSSINFLINSIKKQKVLRPVICICNNLYSTVLRNLRKYCLIIEVHPPSNQKLLDRLTHICKAQGISSTNTTLSKLISQFSGDIRKCITELQMVTKGTGKLDSQTLMNETSNPDDKFKFGNLLSAIFLKQSFPFDDVNFFNVLETFDDFAPLFELSHHSAVSYFSDPLLRKHVSYASLFSNANATSRSSQVLALMTLRQRLSVESVNSSPRISRDCFSRKFEVIKQHSILESFHSLLSPIFKSFFSITSARLFLLSSIFNIIIPNISSCFAPSEEDLLKIKFSVSFLSNFGFSFTKTSLADGSTQLVLEPDISSLILGCGNLSNDLLMVLNRELEHLDSSDSNPGPLTPTVRARAADLVLSPEVKRRKTSLSSFLAIGSPKINRKSKKLPITFKFHEGATKAVRRSVVIDELL
ncbi:hypothetical protein P9112_002604 [Eukaryota sp. TZLM1-RC]